MKALLLFSETSAVPKPLMHIAQFLCHGPTYHSLAMWRHPRTAAAGYPWTEPELYQHIAQDYVKKRDLLCDTLTEIGLTPSIPKGAYYVLADASILAGRNSKEKYMTLLRETGVASVAGSAFYHGADGENLIRFCFAKTDAELEEACRRLKSLPEKLGKASLASHTR